MSKSLNSMESWLIHVNKLLTFRCTNVQKLLSRRESSTDNEDVDSESIDTESSVTDLG